MYIKSIAIRCKFARFLLAKRLLNEIIAVGDREKIRVNQCYGVMRAEEVRILVKQLN